MKFTRISGFAYLLGAIACFQTINLLAGDWPTFRGTDRRAYSTEKDLLKSWPEAGPPIVWKSEGIGRGYTSPAIMGNQIFLVGDNIADAKDTDEYLICLNREDGKRQWVSHIGQPWQQGQPNWQSSRSTPTVDGDRVYALSADSVLVCCDTKTGTEKWRKNLKMDFGGNKADSWGYSESVLIDGDKLVCTPGGPKSTMVALNKQTGDTIWTCVRDGDIGAAHTSIVISEIGGVRVYVQTTGSGEMGVRADDGKLLWSYPVEKTTAIAPTPIIKGNLVFFAAGYKRGGALLKQSPDGNGGVKVEEVYGMKPPLANKHGGVVLVGDYIYGDSDDAGMPYCANLMTGEVLWKSRGTGKNSIAIAAADDRLYLHYADGTMVLAKASPEKYEETGSFTVPNSGERPSWTHPVILDGKLYLREQNALLCYDIKDHAKK